MDMYQIVETARKTGKVDKGVNEVTKAVERGQAKLVVYAEDVSPKEIVQHLPVLCDEKGIPCATVDSKKKLGVAAGINVGTAAVAVMNAGESADALDSLKADQKSKAKK